VLAFLHVLHIAVFKKHHRYDLVSRQAYKTIKDRGAFANYLTVKRPSAADLLTFQPTVNFFHFEETKILSLA